MVPTDKTYTKDIGRQLEAILPASRIKTRLIDLVSYASDAGFYYLEPRAVVLPVSKDEVIALLAFCNENQVPIVFRTGGTSLSGQSVTDGILADLSQHWRKIAVEGDNGSLVRVQPGVVGAMANAHLKQYARKIGPDPASIGAAMMGGILSNNASGMCCGVANNSYHTVRYIHFVLPSGHAYSTESKDDYARFEHELPRLCEKLLELKQRIQNDPDLYKKVRDKYQTKNTVGYSVNAFIDFDHPLDILAHLMVGAEGSLGFIAEAVLNTVPDKPVKATAMLYFNDIYSACKAIEPLTAAGAEAVELMDRSALRS